MESRPTSEQQTAIDTELNEFVVLASAGSGKTRVLTQRYLRLIEEQGLSPDEILTITFTKKAAANMKERIVHALRSRGLFDAAQVAETGPIQTIHSFCERLLRENVLECGLDPEFEILSGSKSSQLKVECIRQSLAAAVEEIPLADRLIRDLAGIYRFSSSGSPYRFLEQTIEGVMENLRSGGKDRLETMETYSSPETLIKFWEDTLVADIPNEAVRAEFDFGGRGSLVDRLQQAFRAADAKMPRIYSTRPTIEDDEAAVLHACGLVLLACDAWGRVENRMRREQALDFTLLESQAVSLLERSEITRARLQKQYRVVMVDEVQDVNPIQFRLLDAIHSESRMYVGDVKQSIYAFRHADVEKFQREAQRIEKLHLTKNFRSKEGIQRYVDTFFRDQIAEYDEMLLPAPFDLDVVSTVEFPGVEHWYLSKGDVSGVAKYVREIVEESVRPGEIAVLVRDNVHASQIQKALDLQQIESRIVGGSERFYTRLEIRDLANALRSVADPYDDFALLAVLRSPLAEISVDSMVLLAGMSPVVDHLTDFEPPIENDRAKIEAFLRWYRPLKAIADRLSAWEVLSEILARSPYLVALARRPTRHQRIANVRKLLSLAAGEPEKGPLEYAETIREIQAMRHREGDAPATARDQNLVTILTVHKAKGLEFDVVVLPQTEKKLVSSNREVVVEASRGCVAVKFGKTPATIYTHMQERRKQRDLAEEMRVLYVAMTRARKRLCICLYPKSSVDTVSKRIQSTFGESAPGIIERRTFENPGQ